MVSDTSTSSPFKAIADPTRRAILAALAPRELPVRQIAAGFAMSRPAVSKHLRVLKEAGLVTERRSGRQNFYRLDEAPLAQITAWLSVCGRTGQQPAAKKVGRQPAVKKVGGQPAVKKGRQRPTGKTATVKHSAPQEDSTPDTGEWRVW